MFRCRLLAIYPTIFPNSFIDKFFLFCLAEQAPHFLGVEDGPLVSTGGYFLTVTYWILDGLAGFIPEQSFAF
ncbi:hypothetical protein HRG84_12725 [Flavisolibacter sp. BT320]|nr:hypothetical protein [Flavisolibacter longurius]